ncbi:O-linked N-acetylglucosamine transferase, SPINDLY family protein [Paraburkholderia acidisoli]|uniref:protein O-GlcNAc transferase n=1 Tax=Paraburkholderia acidisoli TaxID=2571748 RepID=A0A7Z2GLA2_9BURK|nr:tetratricopeptide repeat protein [Paraburkholderia acidisoli]QGZ63731.1 tetratricopeptide repeat protein [Paraburkholderia acidisoli]
MNSSRPSSASAAARSHATTLLQRGIGHLNDEKYPHAQALFREILAEDPQHADALHLLGVTLARQSQFAEAEKSIRAALAQRESGTYRRDLAWTLLWQGRDGEAIEAYRAAIGHGVREARVFNNLGNLLKKRHSIPQAEACYREAIATDPRYAVAYSNLAMLQQDAGQLEAAGENLREALKLDGNSPHLWQCYGGLLERMDRIEEADEAYCRGGRWEAAQYVRRREAHWRQLDEIDTAALSMVAQGTADNLTPWCLLGIPSLTPELHRDAGARFAQSRWRGELAAPFMVARGAGLAAALARCAAGERLRVGYLSADFYDHATLRLLAGVLELHDAARFDVHLYSYGPDPDATARERFAHVRGTWHDLSALSDAQAAAQIAHDGVHLLVDLKGYTTGARLGITALRPAPVVVSWLGYPGSLGHARLADYVISDAIVSPPAMAAHYSETLALMPQCYQPVDHRRHGAAVPTRAQAGLPETGFVFCSFNQTFKFNAPMSALWARLLKATPGSVLWLLDPGSGRARGNLRQFYADQGVDAARVIFAPKLPQESHLARLPLADLALDTLPTGSHTTGSDALWAGVPMVSVPGTLFAGRVGASLLHAVGLDELVARDLDAYFQIALGFAFDAPWRARVRDKLAAARGTAPLFDTPAFTRDLERLYMAIVEREAHGTRGDRTPVIAR